MMSSGINLVMTVIGFSLSVLFIVFVCTRLIYARVCLNATRRSFATASRSDPSILESGPNGFENRIVANFATKKYRELCLTSIENEQCSICLSEYHEEDTLHILPICDHFFHVTCIEIWLQQHSTCPVCRISLRELPPRKWYMQPMFSSAIRYQRNRQSRNSYYCLCMGNSFQHPSRSIDNQIIAPVEVVHHQTEGDVVNDIGNGNFASVDRDYVIKDSVDKMTECPSRL